MQKSSLDRLPSIGVLMFATAGDRIVGDPGMPGTFSFPVVYEVVPGSYRDLIQGTPDICKQLCVAARHLEQKGVSGIVGDCGLMALYQKEIAQSVRIPVVSSSLMLLPIIQQMIGTEQKVGILTGHSKLLTARHLESASADLSRVVIQGMEDEPHFRQVVLEGTTKQEYHKMACDVQHAINRMLTNSKDIGAILFECSNLASFAWEIIQRYGMPVFDINLAIRFLYQAQSGICYREGNM